MRMMPIPPGPGGVAMAAMVSSALLEGVVCSKVFNESTTYGFLLLLVITDLPFWGRSFSAFTAWAINQHLFKESFSHASAADVLVILQGKVNNTTF